MFLISEPLLSYLEIYTIESSYRSDHSVISMSLVFNDFKKFNNSLRYGNDYLECITDVIFLVMKQYVVPVYYMNN